MYREKNMICMVRTHLMGDGGLEAAKNLMVQVAEDLLAKKIDLDNIYAHRDKLLAETTGKIVRKSPKASSAPRAPPAKGKLGKTAMKVAVALATKRRSEPAAAPALKRPAGAIPEVAEVERKKPKKTTKDKATEVESKPKESKVPLQPFLVRNLKSAFWARFRLDAVRQ